MNPLFRPLLTQSFKSTGVYLLLIALILAISATTALKFSNEQIQNAVALQAAEMLAGDLVLSDNKPIAPRWEAAADELALKQSSLQILKRIRYGGDDHIAQLDIAIQILATPYNLQSERELSKLVRDLTFLWRSSKADFELRKLVPYFLLGLLSTKIPKLHSVISETLSDICTSTDGEAIVTEILGRWLVEEACERRIACDRLRNHESRISTSIDPSIPKWRIAQYRFLHSAPLSCVTDMVHLISPHGH